MRRDAIRAFTLVEMLISISILVIIVLFITQLLNSATGIITQGLKHMDVESQVRPFFDQFGQDVAQMVKRNDVGFYLKHASTTEMGVGGTGVNDRLAFFSSAPGSYDTANVFYNSRYSLVAYRVNADPTAAAYGRVERMAKGLPLSGAYATSPGGSSANVTPLLFFAPAPGAAYTGPASCVTTIDGPYGWPSATAPYPSADYYSTDFHQRYQLIASQIFRFEYYFLTATSPPTSVSYPSASFSDSARNWQSAATINVKDVSAIIVAVAAIDPQSKKLLSSANIDTLVTKFSNYATGVPGSLLTQWRDALQNDADIVGMPRPAIQSVRFYERYFYLDR
jgi:prepilin-type N-terminal cleavage/methylation domain-containing protein